METLFIADDENSIREGLKQIIDWESLGFQLCGEASNGKDALSQILALNPGLVLLDVKMPGLHGTEVIRRARKSGFQGKCIILSGYSDFKYAQEAMKSGVRFYLTKPIDEDELYQAVSQIRDELALAKQNSSHLNAYDISYEDAVALLDRQFFCPPEQHEPDFETLSAASQNAVLPSGGFSLSAKDLSDYVRRLCDCLSSYNRRMIVDILRELALCLEPFSGDIPQIRLFLTDLFLQIKEKMTHHYPTLTLPFRSNSEAIHFIQKSRYLYEILRFMSEQFEAVMGALGNSAKDTILYDVLFYIDHHYKENIKLETIASLFGYNSAYLGKIFTKNVGESFNAYVDHRRIDRSKELLLEHNLKVYEIASQVGYKNVDYFHKKFRKYVGMSPAEFRKSHGLNPDSEVTPPPKKMA